MEVVTINILVKLQPLVEVNHLVRRSVLLLPDEQDEFEEERVDCVLVEDEGHHDWIFTQGHRRELTIDLLEHALLFRGRGADTLEDHLGVKSKLNRLRVDLLLEREAADMSNYDERQERFDRHD